ncbi:hypothetical protein N7530_002464 [Penicillium desertorum]|uniref:Uncharacterized protein n=1 Tax=Penicillium desertorum TaxID=1303715 RepID=A0A9X0BT27_9EURO|nr:hypothetical protein N7530_002464 [Penicillium desertorum]
MVKRKMRYDSHKPTKSKSTRKKVDDDDDGGPTNITSRPKDRVVFVQVMEKQLKAERKKVEKEEENQKGIHLELHWSPGHRDIATFQGTRLLTTCPGARSRSLRRQANLGHFDNTNHLDVFDSEDAESVVYADAYVDVTFDSDGSLIEPTKQRSTWAPGDDDPGPRLNPLSALNRACAPLATAVTWNNEGESVPPKQGVRLSDELVYVAAKNMSSKQLAQRYPLDFDGNGLLRATRTPQDPAPPVWAHQRTRMNQANELMTRKDRSERYPADFDGTGLFHAIRVPEDSDEYSSVSETCYC